MNAFGFLVGLRCRIGFACCRVPLYSLSLAAGIVRIHDVPISVFPEDSIMRSRRRNTLHTLLVLTMGLLVPLFNMVPPEDAEGRAPAPVPRRHVLTGIIKLKG